MKPGDVLLGVLDFFAILLPGGVATWIMSRYIPPDVLRSALLFGESDAGSPDGIRLGAAFLLASYVLGHLVFMIGSKLDAPYDSWRGRKKPKSTDTAFAAA